MGGRKKRRKLDQATGDVDWKGRQEKEQASLVFREVWEKAKNWEGYVRRKEQFLERQKEWKRAEGKHKGNAKKAEKREKRKLELENVSKE